jgi:hypothetical protein
MGNPVSRIFLLLHFAIECHTWETEAHLQDGIHAMLHISAVKFFLERMDGHDRVEQCRQVKAEGEYVFEIERKDNLPRVTVHLSDAYDYGHWEYASRPKLIGRGDFILIAGFNTRFDSSLVEIAREDGIGIGGIAKLMGALNWEKVWLYRSPEERGKIH